MIKCEWHSALPAESLWPKSRKARRRRIPFISAACIAAALMLFPVQIMSDVTHREFLEKTSDQSRFFAFRHSHLTAVSQFLSVLPGPACS